MIVKLDVKQAGIAEMLGNECCSMQKNVSPHSIRNYIEFSEGYL
jgi:hypothetical protein